MKDNKQLLASTDSSVAKSFWSGFTDYYVNVTEFDDLRARATVEALLHEADVKDGYWVFDAGCGHLRVTSGMLRLRKDLHPFGADITFDLLAKGRKTCEEKNNIAPHLSCADLRHLPYEDVSFDAAVCARVFQYISEPVDALKEIRRVLKPGARVALSVPNRYNPIKRGSYPGKLYAPGELKAWLEAAGFTGIQVRSICFVPGFFRRGWESRWICFERLSRLPLIGLIGGNALASGRA